MLRYPSSVNPMTIMVSRPGFFPGTCSGSKGEWASILGITLVILHFHEQLVGLQMTCSTPYWNRMLTRLSLTYAVFPQPIIPSFSRPLSHSRHGFHLLLHPSCHCQHQGNERSSQRGCRWLCCWIGSGCSRLVKRFSGFWILDFLLLPACLFLCISSVFVSFCSLLRFFIFVDLVRSIPFLLVHPLFVPFLHFSSFPSSYPPPNLSGTFEALCHGILSHLTEGQKMIHSFFLKERRKSNPSLSNSLLSFIYSFPTLLFADSF